VWANIRGGHTDCQWPLVCREEQKCGVLIIENEPSVADALRIILEDGGYRVSIALTGRDGIEQARQGEFCLSITDGDLGDMTGFDVINAICGHKPELHFIVITSSRSQDVIAEARNCKAAGVLLKPFLPSEILQLIRTTLSDPQVSGNGGIFLGLPDDTLHAY